MSKKKLIRKTPWLYRKDYGGGIIDWQSRSGEVGVCGGAIRRLLALVGASYDGVQRVRIHAQEDPKGEWVFDDSITARGMGEGFDVPFSIWQKLHPPTYRTVWTFEPVRFNVWIEYQ